MSFKPCPECGDKRLYKMKEKYLKRTGAPGFLAGLGTFWQPTTFDAVVCEGCGFVRLFLSEDARRKLPTAKQWEHVL